jgi:hypothetical protein
VSPGAARDGDGAAPGGETAIGGGGGTAVARDASSAGGAGAASTAAAAAQPNPKRTNDRKINTAARTASAPRRQ